MGACDKEIERPSLRERERVRVDSMRTDLRISLTQDLAERERVFLFLCQGPPQIVYNTVCTILFPLFFLEDKIILYAQ